MKSKKKLIIAKEVALANDCRAKESEKIWLEHSLYRRCASCGRVHATFKAFLNECVRIAAFAYNKAMEPEGAGATREVAYCLRTSLEAEIRGYLDAALHFKFTSYTERGVSAVLSSRKSDTIREFIRMDHLERGQPAEGDLFKKTVARFAAKSKTGTARELLAKLWYLSSKAAKDARYYAQQTGEVFAGLVEEFGTGDYRQSGLRYS